MSFALKRRGLGEQQHAKRCASLPAGLRKIHLEQLNETTFSLSSRRIPVERKTPTVKRDVDLDMESCQNHISDEDSG